MSRLRRSVILGRESGAPEPGCRLILLEVSDLVLGAVGEKVVGYDVSR